VNARTVHLHDRGSRVLGFFAYAGPDEVFRFEEACVIAGSRERLQACLAVHPNLRSASLTLAKIRFGDVHAGLDAGAAYALDEEAFKRFAPLFRALVFQVWVFPWICITILWGWIFNKDYGLINYMLTASGITETNLDILFHETGAQWVMIAGFTWRSIP